ncbi:hypothetical protein GQX74_011109 [Glossina fuscipes]|nr:hypothetical protein GQX74_011109 [Glossina fuscipes]
MENGERMAGRFNCEGEKLSYKLILHVTVSNLSKQEQHALKFTVFSTSDLLQQCRKSIDEDRQHQHRHQDSLEKRSHNPKTQYRPIGLQKLEAHQNHLGTSLYLQYKRKSLVTGREPPPDCSVPHPVTEASAPSAGAFFANSMFLMLELYVTEEAKRMTATSFIIRLELYPS